MNKNILPRITQKTQTLNGSHLEIPLGVGMDKTVIWDTKEIRNVAVLGASGTGKTILINTVLDHLNNHSDQWKFYGFSPRPSDIELNSYKGTEAYGGVANTLDDACALMGEIIQDLEYRSKKVELSDISHVEQLPGNPFPSIMVVVDDFFTYGSGQVEDDSVKNALVDNFHRIAIEGKPLGIHVLTSMKTLKNPAYYGVLPYCDMKIALGSVDDTVLTEFLSHHKESKISALSYPQPKGRGIVVEKETISQFQAYYTSSPEELALVS